MLPYYKTILPLINGFKNRTNASSGDQMDFGNGTDLQTTISHFLDVLRETGGKAAFAKVRHAHQLTTRSHVRAFCFCWLADSPHARVADQVGDPNLRVPVMWSNSGVLNFRDLVYYKPTGALSIIAPLRASIAHQAEGVM